MTEARSDFTEEYSFREDARRGSQRLLNAILRAAGITARHAPPRQSMRLRRAANDCAEIARIQRLVAAHYGLRPDDLTRQCRQPHLVTPRHVAMLLAREMGKSLPVIGRNFGRDHTTVLHACRKVAGQPALSADIAVLRKAINRTVKEPQKTVDGWQNSANFHAGNAIEQGVNNQAESRAA